MHILSSYQGPPEGRAKAADEIRDVKVLEEVLGRVRQHPSHSSARPGLLRNYCVPGRVLGIGMHKRRPAAMMELASQSGEAVNTQANKATEEALSESDKCYGGNKTCWKMTAWPGGGGGGGNCGRRSGEASQKRGPLSDDLNFETGSALGRSGGRAFQVERTAGAKSSGWRGEACPLPAHVEFQWGDGSE